MFGHGVGQAVGVQFDLKVLASSWFDTCFLQLCSSATSGGWKHKVSPKTKTLGCETDSVLPSKN